MNRRDAIRSLSLAGGASLLGASEARPGTQTPAPAVSPAYAQAVKGTAPVKIRDIKTILTAPNRIRLVVVKVETTEPGLVGWGCATFTQRALVVETAIEKYLKPFLTGRNVDEIEDIWQSSYMSSYWRNGPVLFNAMSGVDIALWDIKGKRAGMPLYQLLGGKVRHGADCYYHASGNSFTEVEENARAGMERGFRHVRVQVATPGYAGYGARGTVPDSARDPGEAIGPTNPRAIWEPGPYVRMLPKFFEHLRTKLGDEVELLHDVHERIHLNQAINLCKALEPYRLFFLEDPFPPEDNDHFRLLRQQTSIPIAMGELFNTQHEYLPLIKDRLIDFIRIHISQIGGLSPARKVRPCASTSACAPPGTVRATRRRSRMPRSSRSSSPATTSASTRAEASRRRRRRSLPAAPKSRTATCWRAKNPGSGSTSTRSSPPSSRSRTVRRTSIIHGARRGARTGRSFGRSACPGLGARGSGSGLGTRDGWRVASLGRYPYSGSRVGIGDR